MKKTFRMELSVDCDEETCRIIKDSLSPDNDLNITAECIPGKFNIIVENLKISSLYNTTDDIVRCYEVSKKIKDEGL